MINSLMFIGLAACISVFPTERDTYYRERLDGSSSAAPFALAYFLTEFPFELLVSLFYVLVAIIAVGFRLSAESFFLYLLLVFCVINAGESIGILVCAVVPQPDVSVSITNVILLTFVVMAGIQSPEMPLVGAAPSAPVSPSFLTLVCPLRPCNE